MIVIEICVIGIRGMRGGVTMKVIMIDMCHHMIIPNQESLLPTQRAFGWKICLLVCSKRLRRPTR